MRFGDIRHQGRAISILRRALASGRTHHAYLFDGPDGVGKELTGRALAGRLLCRNETLAADDEACGACASCRLMASDNHPDFHLIHRGLHKLHPERSVRASKGLFLAVHLIRTFVIEPAGLKPTQGARRVFLIRDAERMNEEAQNALLKTLEEPPGQAVLILVTASAARLLPTIRSRCQQVPFGALPPAFVADELRSRVELPAADAQALAVLSGGRLGVALDWHRLGLLDAAESVGAALESLADGAVEPFGKGLVDLATELAGRARGNQDAEPDEEPERDDEDEEPRAGGRTVATDALRDALKLVLLLVAALYREALLIHSDAAGLRTLTRARALAERLAGRYAFDELEARIAAVSAAERMLDRNVAPQLVCERLGVALLGELMLTG